MKNAPNKIDAAVIVPVYNRAQTVLRTLASIRDLIVAPRQVIVVDDGSTDETFSSVCQWIAENKMTTWQVTAQDNLGAGAARNRGLRDAGDCEFVSFLDSDDCWPDDFLIRAASLLSSDHSAIGCTADRLTHYWATGKKKLRSSVGLANDPTMWLLENGAGIGSATLFRTSAICRRGGYDESIPTGQDLAFFLRLSVDGPWLHAPGKPVDYHLGLCDGTAEAGNLHQQYDDCHRRWASIQQEFLHSGNLDRHISYEKYCRTVAKAWSRAARRYAALGQRARAGVCRRRAAACLSTN